MDINISYEHSDFNYDLIVPFIQKSYWGKGRSYENIVQAFSRSFVVGFFSSDGTQIGWARATSDTIYHAYIFDLAIVEEHRGTGLGKKLTLELMSHPELKDVAGWMLATKKHHGMYRKLGFKGVESGRYMSYKKSVANT